MAKVIRVSDKSDIQEAPGLDAVAELGIEYGVLAEMPARGLSFAKGRVPSGGTVPMHAGPGDYALFVTAGSGFLTLYNAEGAETDRLRYAPGDLILFPPNSQHGWINDAETDFEWFGVDIAAG
ncbi:cupin domain-containing protein [Cognatishimia maritima]|uniref:Cupin domain-containing protein n=1 Tax=Cognatishimia maritima TaxID=870908 RepID=A0A1M5QH09_9RHOB|nr:cupin domain-containing protein [Cognatishimia maritima]SHH13372.1 Cupin domain-containing protein [Cognatishimia maritima]